MAVERRPRDEWRPTEGLGRNGLSIPEEEIDRGGPLAQPNGSSAVEVPNLGQIQPAFIGLDVGDISDPALVWIRRGRSFCEAIGSDSSGV